MNFLSKLFGKKSQNTLSVDEAEDLWQKAKELKKSGKKRNQKKAIKVIFKLIEQGPSKEPDILSELKCFIADVYTQKLKQHDKAIKYYREALDDNPNNSLAGSNLGFVYMMYKKDYAKAVEILQRTLDRGVSEAFIRGSTEDWLADSKKKLEG